MSSGDILTQSAKRLCKTTDFFFSKTFSVYARFGDQRFNDTITNEIVSFEQLSPVRDYTLCMCKMIWVRIFSACLLTYNILIQHRRRRLQNRPPSA